MMHVIYFQNILEAVNIELGSYRIKTTLSLNVRCPLLRLLY